MWKMQRSERKAKVRKEKRKPNESMNNTAIQIQFDTGNL